MRLPNVDSPLAKLRIRCEQERVLVSADEGTFEAATGQLLLDFEVATLERDVAEVRTLPWVGRGDGDVPLHDDPQDRPTTAYDWFARGRDFEGRWDGHDAESPALHEAIESYRQALEIDPRFAAASTNLGSLYAELGDLESARDAFDQALDADPNQPEAQANLAELALRQGETELAISGFRQILRQNPDYIEAHYGLARALLLVGGKAQALAHLERFCGAYENHDVSAFEPELRERLAQSKAVIEAIRRELGG